jgi:hypothetical protein
VVCVCVMALAGLWCSTADLQRFPDGHSGLSPNPIVAHVEGGQRGIHLKITSTNLRRQFHITHTAFGMESGRMVGRWMSAGDGVGCVHVCLCVWVGKHCRPSTPPQWQCRQHPQVYCVPG